MELSLDEMQQFKIMIALMKATKSVNHAVVASWCQRKGISVEKLLDETMRGGKLRDSLNH